MEWVETTGRTIAEALDAALDELGVDEEDVEYEVLEEPKSGFLGRLGSSEGRIRARVKPISREKPGERQRRNAPRLVAAAVAAVGVAGTDRTAAPASRTAADRPARVRGEGTSSSSSRRRRRGRRQQWFARARVGDARQDQQQGSTVDTIESDVPIEEQAAAAERFTQGLVDAFDLGAQAKSVIDDDVVIVDVTGENLGLLVGPKGATLHAIEELVRTVVQRQTDGHGVAHPRRRRRLPGQAPRGARRLHPRPRREGARDRSGAGARADVGERPQGRPRHRGGDRRDLDGVGGRGPPPARGPAPGLIHRPAPPTDRDDRPRSGEAPRRPRGGPRARPARARSGGAPVRARARSGALAIGDFDGRMLDLGSGGGLPGLVLFDRWPGARAACCSTPSAADASS